MAADMLVKFKRARVEAWTRDRIESLSTLEVRQLGANATRLAETELAALCDEAPDPRPSGQPPPPTPAGGGVSWRPRGAAAPW